jgi:predicted DNA-binding protein (MmcQ/YjbR family)
MAKRGKSTGSIMAELRTFGLTLPGAHTKTPWPGHLDLAIKGKTFAFMSTDGEPFSITCKLPENSVAALMFPFAAPAAYGLGKSGWVNARFEASVSPPSDLLAVFKEWIVESYRATAPKKLIAAMEAQGLAADGGKASRPKKASTRAAPATPAAATTKRSAAARKSTTNTTTQRPSRKKTAPNRKRAS